MNEETTEITTEIISEIKEQEQATNDIIVNVNNISEAICEKSFSTLIKEEVKEEVKEAKFNPLDEWKEMPEYLQEKQVPYKELKVRFRNAEDYQDFANKVEQELTHKSKSIWYPKLDSRTKEGLRYVEE